MTFLWFYLFKHLRREYLQTPGGYPYLPFYMLCFVSNRLLLCTVSSTFYLFVQATPPLLPPPNLSVSPTSTPPFAYYHTNFVSFYYPLLADNSLLTSPTCFPGPRASGLPTYPRDQSMPTNAHPITVVLVWAYFLIVFIYEFICIRYSEDVFNLNDINIFTVPFWHLLSNSEPLWPGPF